MVQCWKNINIFSRFPFNMQPRNLNNFCIFPKQQVEKSFQRQMDFSIHTDFLSHLSCRLFKPLSSKTIRPLSWHCFHLSSISFSPVPASLVCYLIWQTYTVNWPKYIFWPPKLPECEHVPQQRKKKDLLY